MRSLSIFEKLERQYKEDFNKEGKEVTGDPIAEWSREFPSKWLEAAGFIQFLIVQGIEIEPPDYMELFKYLVEKG